MKPLNKGSNYVKVPFLIKSSSKVFASWAYEVREGIKTLKDRIPIGQGAVPGGAGSSAPFFVRVKRKNSGGSPQFFLSVTPGYVEYQNCRAIDADEGILGTITPQINGVNIDSKPQPLLSISGTTGFVYLSIKTDADGMPTFSPSDCEVRFYQDKPTSTHHVRDSEDGETEGEYYFFLAEIEPDPEAAIPTPSVKKRVTGNRFIPNQMIKIKNLGGGYPSKIEKIYKGYKPEKKDVHEFRGLEQIDTGEAIIKPESDETIKFRGIKAKYESEITVEVGDNGETIQISGNGFNSPYEQGAVTNLEVKDGLVTGFKTTQSTGGNLNLIVKAYNILTQPPYIAEGTSSVTLYYRSGVYVGSSEEMSEPAVTNDNPLKTKTVVSLG